jgi:hypothetical protein
MAALAGVSRSHPPMINHKIRQDAWTVRVS